ncbi:MAG: hypothetical protein ACTSO5_06945 [Candidatus Heimdallarchaeaceae archaeon]
MSEKDISWDLSEIFKGPDDPQINEAITDVEKRSEEFITKYKGKIIFPDFRFENLLELIQDQEKFYADLFEISQYARLSFSGNMTVSEFRKLNNRAQEFSARIRKKLAFLEIDVGKYVYENQSIVKDSRFENYKHYLENIIRSFPSWLARSSIKMAKHKNV